MTPPRTGLPSLVLAVASIAAAGELPAQAYPGPEGEWNAVWASAVRTDGDSILVQRRSPAHLRLERRGDTVSGTWSTEIVDAETWVITGSYAGGVLRMEARTTVDGTLPGEGGARLIRLEWTGRLSEDGAALEGEQWLTLETPRGVLRSDPRPWTARRHNPDQPGGRVSRRVPATYRPRSRPPPPAPPCPCPPGRRHSPS